MTLKMSFIETRLRNVEKMPLLLTVKTPRSVPTRVPVLGAIRGEKRTRALTTMSALTIPTSVTLALAATRPEPSLVPVTPVTRLRETGSRALRLMSVLEVSWGGGLGN